jgi:SAM-dependent methyltransferase
MNKSAQGFWDELWGDGEGRDFWKRVAPEIVELIESQSPKERPEVLDLGCGLGRNAIAFAEAGFRVTATDFSPRAVDHLSRWASERGLSIETIVSGFDEDIFAPESFDIIVSVNVLYHGHREQSIRSIANVREWLKTSGLFYFTVPTREDGEMDPEKEIAPNTFELDPGHVHYCADEEDLREFLEGFRVLSRTRKDHDWVDRQGSHRFSSRWRVLAEKV